MPFGALMLAEVRSLVGESKGFDLRALEPFRAQGLHTDMYIVPMLAVVLALVLFAASRTIRKDVANLQEWMASASASACKESPVCVNALVPAVLVALGAVAVRQHSPAAAL